MRFQRQAVRCGPVSRGACPPPAPCPAPSHAPVPLPVARPWPGRNHHNLPTEGNMTPRLIHRPTPRPSRDRESVTRARASTTFRRSVSLAFVLTTAINRPTGPRATLSHELKRTRPRRRQSGLQGFSSLRGRPMAGPDAVARSRSDYGRDKLVPDLAHQTRTEGTHPKSVVVRSPADSAAHHAEHHENQAYHHQDDSDRPQNRDLGQKADNQEYHSKCYH
jgi:hypothetical protein